MQFPTFAILALAATLVQAAPQDYSKAGISDAIKCMRMDKQFDSHMRSSEAELPSGIDKCHEFIKYADDSCNDDKSEACYTAAWATWASGSPL
ncbi:hypothetical protein DFP73DRAFT_550847 [Morchella snyderi]|nr:hypothetical protein DFP73DRAFT_550847 [Morchella snyderi]